MERTLAPRKRTNEDGGPPTKPVRIHAGIASKAKIIAAGKGIDISDYITDMIKARVLKDWADLVRETNRD